MNIHEIMQVLKMYKSRFGYKYGIISIGVFGSYAKGYHTEKSDIDIVVELQDPDLFKMVHIKEELEELLGIPVDIVRKRKNMNPFLLRHIEKEALFV